MSEKRNDQSNLVPLFSCTIICADHFEPLPKVLIHNKVNVNWCFACCSPGELLNCSTCPSAYHRACTPNKSPEHDKQAEETWRCGECLAGKRPLNGDIVWAKVGMYRWWPAQICLQRFLPDKVKNKSGQVGEFPVKFFGTNDFYWVNLGRCFVFADGDEFQRNISAGKSLGVAYTNGVIDAIVAFRELKRLKTKHYTVTKTSVQKRQEYIPIRQCKPVGNVRVVRVPLSEQPHCDCAKSEANPCALASSCVNVALKYECKYWGLESRAGQDRAILGISGDFGKLVKARIPRVYLFNECLSF
jgi:histone-lysine N-methyltransferase NSD2